MSPPGGDPGWRFTARLTFIEIPASFSNIFYSKNHAARSIIEFFRTIYYWKDVPENSAPLPTGCRPVAGRKKKGTFRAHILEERNPALRIRECYYLSFCFWSYASLIKVFFNFYQICHFLQFFQKMCVQTFGLSPWIKSIGMLFLIFHINYE